MVDYSPHQPHQSLTTAPPATIPIVLAVAFDPVSAGLVTSLAQPGGNVTGISIQQPELIGKRLELLREVMPQLRRLAIMANAGYAAPVLEAEKTKATAQALGLEAARLAARSRPQHSPRSRH
jgi:putative ABC transport system substrate-binding protein